MFEDDGVTSHCRWDQNLMDAIPGVDHLYPSAMELRMERYWDGRVGGKAQVGRVTVEGKVVVKDPTCAAVLGSQIRDEIAHIPDLMPSLAFLHLRHTQPLTLQNPSRLSQSKNV